MKTHHTCAEVFSVGALTPVTQSFVSSGQNEGLKAFFYFYNKSHPSKFINIQNANKLKL